MQRLRGGTGGAGAGPRRSTTRPTTTARLPPRRPRAAQATASDAAALVMARAHLERYRQKRRLDGSCRRPRRAQRDSVRRCSLRGTRSISSSASASRCILTDLFGAAADLFDTALERGAPLARRAIVRCSSTGGRRRSIAKRRRGTPERRLASGRASRRADGRGAAPRSRQRAANYWLAVAARAAGDLDAAWDAAVAAWVRATLGPAPSELRSDIDRLVTQALIPERARVRSAREQGDATEAVRAQWESVKEQWK